MLSTYLNYIHHFYLDKANNFEDLLFHFRLKSIEILKIFLIYIKKFHFIFFYIII